MYVEGTISRVYIEGAVSRLCIRLCIEGTTSRVSGVYMQVYRA